MPIRAESANLLCSACGRTFNKPRSALQAHSLVACPHCATLQSPRLAREPAAGTTGGMVRPTYRNGP